MKYTIEVEWEQVDALVQQELRESLKNLVSDWHKVTNDIDTISIFSMDKDAELEEIQKYIDAFELVLDYMGG